jgi:hypothetical protein
MHACTQTTKKNTFSPIDPRKGSPTFGQITSTPKVAWRGFNVYNALDKFNVPTAFDTDVNAPAMWVVMRFWETFLDAHSLPLQ